MHSQAVRSTALHPWLVSDENGSIITANCDCKAGLGATCTHVAAMLFYIEAAIRIRETPTVTQEKAYWLLPNPVREVPYLEISATNFTSASSKRLKLDESINNACSIVEPTASSTPVQSVVKYERYQAHQMRRRPGFGKG